LIGPGGHATDQPRMKPFTNIGARVAFTRNAGENDEIRMTKH